MLYRNQIRTVKNSTETTLETSTTNSNTLAFNISTTDAFYIGFHERFTTRYLNVSTVNTANTANLAVTYWNGTAWTAVDDLIDQTDACTSSGFIGWQNQSDWTKYALSPISDVELYWIRIKTDVNFSAGTVLQSVNNLFCDDRLLRAYYPELITDTRYLPTGRTDYIEQYEAAKNLVVQRLKQERAITNESQIIDINEVALAAVHAAAHIILYPIARTEEARQASDDAYKKFENELKLCRSSFDLNDSGIVDEVEADVGFTFMPRY